MSTESCWNAATKTLKVSSSLSGSSRGLSLAFLRFFCPPPDHQCIFWLLRASLVCISNGASAACRCGSIGGGGGGGVWGWRRATGEAGSVTWLGLVAASLHAERSEPRRRSLLLILSWQPWPTFHKDRLMQTWWYAYNSGARRALPEVVQAAGGLSGENQLAACSQLCPGKLNKIRDDDARTAWA